ncbi:MAG: hypothetical protein ACRDO0_13235, partial [Nocardioidaceae bacterium]
YLRQRAADFSFSADVNDAQTTARAGMALLDAALLAEAMPERDRRLRELSEAHCFESLPEREARFLETPAIRSAVQRPLSGEPMTGAQVIDLIVATTRHH